MSVSLCISVKLKNLKANHNGRREAPGAGRLCISVKLKNLKANHNRAGQNKSIKELCISVKLKNLKANHNCVLVKKQNIGVVYIRKVKKSESKSQLVMLIFRKNFCCVYP